MPWRASGRRTLGSCRSPCTRRPVGHLTEWESFDGLMKCADLLSLGVDPSGRVFLAPESAKLGQDQWSPVETLRPGIDHLAEAGSSSRIEMARSSPLLSMKSTTSWQSSGRQGLDSQPMRPSHEINDFFLAAHQLEDVASRQDRLEGIVSLGDHVRTKNESCSRRRTNRAGRQLAGSVCHDARAAPESRPQEPR